MIVNADSANIFADFSASFISMERLLLSFGFLLIGGLYILAGLMAGSPVNPITGLGMAWTIGAFVSLAEARVILGGYFMLMMIQAKLSELSLGV